MRSQVRLILVVACGLCALALACSSSHSGSGLGGHGNPYGNSAGNGAGSGTGGAAVVRSDGVGQACDAIGATRTCCDSGRQTCSGTDEFKQWGPCLGPGGKPITCGTTGGPDDCKSGEFSQVCAGGPPPPPPTSCDDSEFPGCSGDGGLPPPPSLCTDQQINNEPEILAAYSPATNESVSQGGQIKVWVNDEWPELIAPNEQIDPATGAIVAAGDRAAKAPDGYLWEPALYIAPMTAESGGTPHFPQFIKGWYNNVPPVNGGMHAHGKMLAAGTSGPAIDPPPPGTLLKNKYSTELIWNVDALGLGPGTYMGEFVILDGDENRAIGCVTITITR